jgi:hypothetical protein
MLHEVWGPRPPPNGRRPLVGIHEECLIPHKGQGRSKRLTLRIFVTLQSRGAADPRTPGAVIEAKYTVCFPTVRCFLLSKPSHNPPACNHDPGR